jgi:hypothetical protein
MDKTMTLARQLSNLASSFGKVFILHSPELILAWMDWVG